MAVLGILVISGLVLLPALLPVAVTDHGLQHLPPEIAKSKNYTDLDKLFMGNVDVNSFTFSGT